jgi:osmotically-inducible protein OsmY
MKKKAWNAAAALAGLIVLASAACRPTQTVERQTDDSSIKAAIKTKLAADVNLATLTSVSVDVTNGVVTLAGPVHNEGEKMKIVRIARAQKGVVSVNDNLQVQAEPPTPAGNLATTPEAVAPAPVATPK